MLLAIPIIGHLLSIFVSVLGFVRSKPGTAARGFAWWLAAGALSNSIQLGLALTKHNNLWVSHIYAGVAIALLGIAGDRILTRPGERRAVRVGTAVAFIGWIVITTLFASLQAFPLYSNPLLDIASGLLGVLLVSHAIRAGESPFSHAAAWMGLGLVLTYVPTFASEQLVTDAINQNATREQIGTLWAYSRAVCDIALVVMAVPYLKPRIRWTD